MAVALRKQRSLVVSLVFRRSSAQAEAVRRTCLRDAQDVTVSCSQGEMGRVYPVDVSVAAVRGAA